MSKTNLPKNQCSILSLLDDGNAILHCGRRDAETRRDDDCVYLLVVDKDDGHEISLTLEEAEPFFDRAISLVDDHKHQPISGSVEIHVVMGGHDYSFAIDVAGPEDEVAGVTLTREGVAHSIGPIMRPVLHRFLVGCLEAICDDLDGDDD
jgi:hypothetical protein